MAALSGAAAGGIVGALVGLGIPEYEAEGVRRAHKERRLPVAVHVEDSDKGNVVRDMLKRNGLQDISSVSER
jgi:hypothetical protein